MKEIKHITLGSDPEIFLVQENKIIGSERIIPIEGLEDKTIIRDGFQVEFNPKSSSSSTIFINNIATCFKKLHEHISNIGMDNVNITFKRAVDITQEEMDFMSATSKVFGCMPSFNIYNENIKLPKDASKIMFRSGGGHIHIGTEDINTLDMIKDYGKIIKIFDIVVGIPLTAIDNDIESNIRRRKYYGRAGEYRMPNYGFEYRTPSNIWLKHPEIAKFVFGTLVPLAIKSLKDNTYIELFKIFNDNQVKEIINNSYRQNAIAMTSVIANILKDSLSLSEYITMKNNMYIFDSYVNITDEQSLQAWLNYK